MPYCADDDDLYKNAASAMGNHNDYTSKGGPDSFDPNAENARRNARAQREETINQTSTAGAASGPTGERMTPGDQRTIRAEAKKIRDLLNEADNYRQRRLDRWTDAMNMVTGLTVGNVNRWLHSIFQIGKWFQNQRNALNEWIYKYAQDPRYQHWAQPLAQMFDAMPNLIRAQQNDFANRQNNLMRSLRPVATRLGVNTRWLSEVLGHYAVMKHIPEANAELLRAWRQELREGVAELNEIMRNPGKNISSRYAKELGDRCTELQQQIQMLEGNLENPNKPKGMVSAGYTNRQARDMLQLILDKTGVTVEEADAFAKALQNEFTYILEKRTQAGLVPKEQLAAFPNFKDYVALISRNENLQGATNDAMRYDPGSYHRRQGTRETPDSAMATLTYYANRAATEIGMQEFATHLYALKKQRMPSARERRLSGQPEGEDIGLRSAKYSTLMRWRSSGVRHLQEIADNVLDAGGLVVDVPTLNRKTGKQEFERQYLWFDADWQGQGAMKNITGKMLNDAISSNYKIGSKAIELAGRATSWHGQLYTRFSLGFAPIGGMRDGMERLFHMVNRNYFADNGEKISNTAVIKDFVVNTKRAATFLGEAILRRPENMSPTARQFWEEYVSQGLYQKLTPGVHSDRMTVGEILDNKPKKVSDLLNQPDTAFLDKWLETTGQYGRDALNTIDKWNDWWQNIASFSQFMTLREHGMSASRARDAVLQEMNMQQRGTLTPYLRIISPFVVPTVQSAAALTRTLGLNAATPADIFKQGWRGWLGVMGGMLAYSVINDAAREKLGYDEDGNSRYDNMKVRDLTSWTPIGINDDGVFLKMPNGFGPARLAQTLVLCTDRVARGLMEPEDMAAEVIFTVAKDVIPATNPQFKFSEKPGEFIMQMLTPDVIKPFMEISSNTNYFGSAIANEPREGVARANQGRTSTDPFWHKTAKFFHQYGILDVPPEHYKHLAQSYGAGPIRALGAVFDAVLGNDTPTSANYDPDGYDGLNPWLRAFGCTGWVGRTKDISRGMYYDLKREMNDKVQRAGVKLTQPDNRGKKEDAATFRRQQLYEAGFSQEEIDDYELVHTADELLRKQNTDFNNQYGNTWYNFEYPDQLREKFAEMDEIKSAIYARVVQEANRYRGRR